MDTYIDVVVNVQRVKGPVESAHYEGQSKATSLTKGKCQSDDYLMMESKMLEECKWMLKNE